MLAKLVATTGFLVILTAAAATPTAAVEVIRGGEAEATESGDAGAVQIIRGNVPEETKKEEPYHYIGQTHVKAGENLWVLDEEAGTITGCDMQDSHLIPFGEVRKVPELLCDTEPWPQEVFFPSVFHR